MQMYTDITSSVIPRMNLCEPVHDVCMHIHIIVMLAVHIYVPMYVLDSIFVKILQMCFKKVHFIIF